MAKLDNQVDQELRSIAAFVPALSRVEPGMTCSCTEHQHFLLPNVCVACVACVAFPEQGKWI